MIHSVTQARQRAVFLLLLAVAAAIMILFTRQPGFANGQPSPTDSVSAIGDLVVTLVNVADGFNQPTDIAHAGDGRLFIVEQPGLIRIIDAAGDVLPTPFLDIQDQVGTGFYEQGLLGLAFDPDYAANGYFFVSYTALDGSSHIARFSVDVADPDVADPDSEFAILTLAQPHQNNNGGDLNFGPDGYLYVALGDGGGVGDPDALAQDGDSLLGKVLRLDVTGVTTNTNYVIPPNNPFVSDPAVRDEIWAVGLRNPWRFSFDRATGDLYLGDVGLTLYEEINFQPANSPGGENYGWRCYEANEPHVLDGCGAVANYDFPAHAYPHYENSSFLGCSVTGGYVYRGSESPDLVGRYIFADYCSGRFWAMSAVGGGGWDVVSLGVLQANVSAFGEGADGELYAAAHGSGVIYRVEGQLQWRSYLPLVSAAAESE